MEITVEMVRLANSLPEMLPRVFGCIPLREDDAGALVMAGREPDREQRSRCERRVGCLVGRPVVIEDMEQEQWDELDEFLYHARRLHGDWCRIRTFLDLMEADPDRAEGLLPLLAGCAKGFALRSGTELRICRHEESLSGKVMELEGDTSGFWRVEFSRGGAWTEDFVLDNGLMEPFMSALGREVTLMGRLVRAGGIPASLEGVTSFVVELVPVAAS